jgi:hypothetical protein
VLVPDLLERLSEDAQELGMHTATTRFCAAAAAAAAAAADTNALLPAL